MLQGSLSRLHVPMIYVNRRGLENNGKTCYTYDGMTASYDRDGNLLAEARPYEDAHSLFSFSSEDRRPESISPMVPCKEDMLLPALRYGVRKFLESIGQDRVVIGISGGIDSAVNAALYRSILRRTKFFLSIRLPGSIPSSRGTWPRGWPVILAVPTISFLSAISSMKPQSPWKPSPSWMGISILRGS